MIEVLRRAPGLHVSQTGGPGGNTSVYLRGMANRHTKVLIDGIEMYDPIGNGGSKGYDFAHLTTDNIERIEVLRGPQSTLYGSESMGGVINIVTKKGEGKPTFYAAEEVGPYKMHREKVGGSGGNQFANFSFAASAYDIDGLVSMADRRQGWPKVEETDAYEARSVVGRFGITPSEILSLDLIGRFLESDVSLDGWRSDDPNHHQEKREYALGASLGLALFGGRWKQTFFASYTGHESHDKDDTDDLGDITRDRFDSFGNVAKFSWQSDIHLHETNTLTIGIETREEMGKYRTRIDTEGYAFEWGGWLIHVDPDYYYNYLGRKHIRSNGYWIQDTIRLFDRWHTTIGARLDDHERFGSHLTWRATSSYRFDRTGTRIHGSYGTGFESPSIYEMYCPEYGGAGNQDLKPETSYGSDIGFDQELWGGKIRFGSTYFYNKARNTIAWSTYRWWPFEGRFENRSSLETEGFENTLTLKPIEKLTIDATFTLLRTEARFNIGELWPGDPTPNREYTEEWNRRPRHTGTVGLDYAFLKNAKVRAEVEYVGSRWEDERNLQPLSRYTICNVAASWDINKHVQLYGRIDNLFDRIYTEVYDFESPRIHGFVGLKVTF